MKKFKKEYIVIAVAIITVICLLSLQSNGNLKQTTALINTNNKVTVSNHSTSSHK